MGKAVKPVVESREYYKFGFVKTRYQGFRCPACKDILSAGPNHQPKRCSNCGVKLDFSGIEYQQEEHLGYKEV